MVYNSHDLAKQTQGHRSHLKAMAFDFLSAQYTLKYFKNAKIEIHYIYYLLMSQFY